MKLNFYILFIFFLSISKQVIGQKISLEINSKDSIEYSIIKDIPFLKKHKNNNSIHNELNLFSNKLKKKGFFFNQLDSLSNSNPRKAYFNFNKKIDSLLIKVNDSITKEIKIDELDFFIDSISNKIEERGGLFSEISLKNITLEKSKLISELQIRKSTLRKNDTTIIKGYPNFPIKYIENFLKIKKGDIINKTKLNEISKNSNEISFVSEIKKPEVLFTKDSTLLYLYLKKKKTSNFDGLLNFSSDKNNSGISFTGYLNLELNNIINKGETFSLLWKANGNENQNFTLNSRIPYIFNSLLSTDIKFIIHKQDSSFLNTQLRTKLSYNLSNKSSVGITYSSETSVKNTNNSIENDSITSFDNYFFGFIYNYEAKKQNNFNDKKIHFQINPTFGKRNTDYQFKLNLTFQYIFDFDKKNSFYIKTKSGYLFSKNNFTNELYRIGGVNSIRGFDEESIFTSGFTYINSEYRYLTSKESYIYSIFDLAHYEPRDNSNDKTIFSLGLGYLFKIGDSQLNMNYTFGKKTPINSFKSNSRISITYKNFFQ